MLGWLSVLQPAAPTVAPRERWVDWKASVILRNPTVISIREQHMTRSGPIRSDEGIIDAMIQLARAAKSNRMIVAGPNSSEVFLELHHRGYLCVTTAKLCRVPCGRFDVALVAWREHSINALETTLDGLVHFLSTTGVLVVWVGAPDRIPFQMLRLALDRLGFRIEACTTCENGVAISARRLESHSIDKVA